MFNWYNKEQPVTSIVSLGGGAFSSSITSDGGILDVPGGPGVSYKLGTSSYNYMNVCHHPTSKNVYHFIRNSDTSATLTTINGSTHTVDTELQLTSTVNNIISRPNIPGEGYQIGDKWIHVSGMDRHMGSWMGGGTAIVDTSTAGQYTINMNPVHKSGTDFSINYTHCHQLMYDQNKLLQLFHTSNNSQGNLMRWLDVSNNTYGQDYYINEYRGDYEPRLAASSVANSGRLAIHSVGRVWDGSAYNEDSRVIVYNTSLSPQWVAGYNSPNGNAYFRRASSLVMDSSGDIYIKIGDWTQNTEVIMKLNGTNGDIIWTRPTGRSGSFNNGTGGFIHIGKDDMLMYRGFIRNAQGTTVSVVARLNPSNGAIIWSAEAVSWPDLTLHQLNDSYCTPLHDTMVVWDRGSGERWIHVIDNEYGPGYGLRGSTYFRPLSVDWDDSTQFPTQTWTKVTPQLTPNSPQTSSAGTQNTLGTVSTASVSSAAAFQADTHPV